MVFAAADSSPTPARGAMAGQLRWHGGAPPRPPWLSWGSGSMAGAGPRVRSAPAPWLTRVSSASASRLARGSSASNPMSC
ncbi:hypothetical protein PR202_gb29567 [Eleusine coracana subsp. coracana]|uniref:Uncharacterized protein n=1 Tax=Eleusine coracana subsp. coracana TaxID=191504 RepID=A0AAV5FZ75_ELECO|nr:hypothetical protein PR202_gb29567 [Eleusine coracana subsp. coracana]